MKTSISIEGISLDVEYTFYRGQKGSRDSLNGIRNAGPPIEPDEPASVEITSVTSTEDIKELLSEELMSKIELKILSESEE